MENIVKILDNIIELTVQLDEVEGIFEDTKKKYTQLDQKRRDLYVERQKLLKELMTLCE